MDKSRLAKIYKPLHPWQTRLLELLPGSADDPLKCNLHVADVIADEGFGLPEQSRVQRYEAISYSWGRPELTARIECNSETLPLPPPLSDALIALRQDQPRWLWCDAICIAQDDSDEKSRQVQMMFKIYQNAHRTIAWLGNSDAQLIQAFNAARAQGQALYPKAKTTPLSEENRQAIEQVFQRSWFSRIWIRQEVVASKDLILQSGMESLPFNTLCGSVGFDRSQEVSSTNTTAHILYEEYNQPHTYTPKALPQAIEEIHKSTLRYAEMFLKHCHEGRLFGATDNRDRIYSLLGLINSLTQFPTTCLDAEGNSVEAPICPVDYGKTVNEVYYEVARYLIALSGRLDLLQCVSWHAGQYPEELPSWVPKWHEYSPRPLWMLEITDHNTLELESQSKQFKSFDLGKELTIFGCVLGRVGVDPYYILEQDLEPCPKSVLSAGADSRVSADDSFLSPTNDDPYRVYELDFDGNENPKIKHLFNNPGVSHGQDTIDILEGGMFYCKVVKRFSHCSYHFLNVSCICVPASSQPDDIIVCCRGNNSPYLLRPATGDKDKYLFVGACRLCRINHSSFDDSNPRLFKRRGVSPVIETNSNLFDTQTLRFFRKWMNNERDELENIYRDERFALV